MSESGKETAVAVFDGNQIRTVEGPDGKKWFVAVDVAEVLGLAKIRSHLASLDEDEKGVQVLDTPGGPQKMNIVSKSGAYGLSFRSRKPKARAFRKWVTSDLLIKLEEDGHYGLNGSGMEALKIQCEAQAKELVNCGKMIRDLEGRCVNYQTIIKRIGFDPDDYEKTNKRGDKRIRIVRAGLRGGKNCQITYKGDIKTIALMMQPNLPFIETVEAMPEQLPFTKSQVALIKEAKSSAIQRREA